MREFLFLALAGALGTLGRYGLSGLAQRIAGNYFPFGTLAVNIIGSILVGFIMQIGLNTDVIPRSLRVVITVGFLGAFTTFSTFAYETTKYLEDGAWLSGLLNISANVVIGIIAILIGMLVGRMTYGGV